MNREPRRSLQALAGPEALAVAAAIAILLGIGYGICKGARLQARLAVAENNLKHVDVAMNLFFNRFGSYPPEGANLVAVLAPYVRDLEVFRNPLADEGAPGQTLSALYREPSLRELDGPGRYITAFVSDDGTRAVILKSGSRIERFSDLALPADAASRVAVLSGTPSQPGADSPPDEQAGSSPDSGDVDGNLNLNPGQGNDFEFYLLKPEGTAITRDDLLASRGSLSYYGEAVRIVFKPKGNGNQNTLTLNGQVYRLENQSRYLIVTLPGGAMTVHLYNSLAGRGAAMGKWWIAINATGARIAACTCDAQECTCGLPGP